MFTIIARFIVRARMIFWFEKSAGRACGARE